MRNWTRTGAEPVLRLRAAQFDGDCLDLWHLPKPEDSDRGTTSALSRMLRHQAV